MVDKTEPKLPSGQVAKWKDQECPTVYANMMGLALTSFDIAVVLGEVGDVTPDVVTGIPRVKVLLSPEQASNLAKLLNAALGQYIETNGQLRAGGAVNLDDFKKHLAANKTASKPKIRKL
jgi:hypothetical protein